MGLKETKKRSNGVLNDVFNALYERGYIDGYDRGYDEGYEDGRRKEIENHNAAVSDGMRSGSSECGKQMNRRKNK